MFLWSLAVWTVCANSLLIAWVFVAMCVIEYTMANITVQSRQDSQISMLLHRAQAGDRSAFDLLVTRYRPLLFALAFLRTGHKEEAEDLVQEVLSRAWQKLPTLADTSLFLPWLKTVTANACNTWFRPAHSRPVSLDSDVAHLLVAQQGLPLKALLEQERQRELQQALLTLPEANRITLLLHIWDHVSY